MKHRIKYPRTFHLPYSHGRTSDDKVLASDSHLIGKWVIITEKYDGENTNMYSDYIHARSIDGRSHPSRDWVKKFHASIAHNIPEGMRICGENVFAKHSIQYDALESYFFGFSIWQDEFCLSWADTMEYFNLLDVKPVKVLYEGIYRGYQTAEAVLNEMDLDKQEGFVVRLADSFVLADFKNSVAKFVRASHVQTDEHWMLSEIVPNKLLMNGEK
jgi:hypothetical protein